MTVTKKACQDCNKPLVRFIAHHSRLGNIGKRRNPAKFCTVCARRRHYVPISPEEWQRRRDESARLRRWKIHLYVANKFRGGTEFTPNTYNAIIAQPCTYCGHSPANGVDRTDSKRGYVIGNCVPACEFCNRAKREYPVSVLLAWLDEVARNRKG